MQLGESVERQPSQVWSKRFWRQRSEVHRARLLVQRAPTVEPPAKTQLYCPRRRHHFLRRISAPVPTAESSQRQ